MNKREREILKQRRTAAAKARAALARKRALDKVNGDAVTMEIPLTEVQVLAAGPARHVPAKVKERPAKHLNDRREVDAVAQLAVAIYLEMKKRSG